MSLVELGSNMGEVSIEDVTALITRQFQEGKQVVFFEENYAHHKIYVSNSLMDSLGEYGEVNQLIRTAFDAVSKTDKTKTRFYFGQTFKLEDQEGVWFDIYYPEGSYQPLSETQEKFLQAVENLQISQ